MGIDSVGVKHAPPNFEIINYEITASGKGQQTCWRERLIQSHLNRDPNPSDGHASAYLEEVHPLVDTFESMKDHASTVQHRHGISPENFSG